LITVCTLLWAPNAKSKSFSTAYTEAWVERLYRGFARHLTRPFRFVCYVDRPREFAEPIDQRLIASAEPSYADCIQPYEMGCPMILVGLDTLVTGNIDHLADYCLTADTLALPRDPFMPSRACNGVALVPAGHEFVFTEWDGQGSDMDRCRAVEHVYIDDLFPGAVQSWKCAVRHAGLGDTRIVYFHGRAKMHELAGEPLIQEHWR
jgi:hypothetical protein